MFSTRSTKSRTVYAHIGVAAAAMVATLPGRTHGLGLITEPLLRDFALDRVTFGVLNFWATLFGAAFCLPVGWWIDRVGVRAVLASILLALGAVVLVMAGLHHTPGATISTSPAAADPNPLGPWSAIPVDLFVLVLLTRGLGQSALSVVSLALLGKVAGRVQGPLVGLYSFLVAFGFMAAFGAILYSVNERHADWRALWSGIGWGLLAFGTVVALMMRNPGTAEQKGPSEEIRTSLTLPRALGTATFWVFGLGTAFFGMVTSGLTLFNESVLSERRFDRGVYLTVMTVFPVVGLAGNLVAGWLATRIRLGILFAGGMAIQGLALATFPLVETLPQVYTYAVLLGVSGGVLTVVFFTVWGQGFGPIHLGKIQGAAQLLTVLASAAGPVALAVSHRFEGSYAPLLQKFAIVSALFAVAAVFVRLPLGSSPADQE